MWPGSQSPRGHVRAARPMATRRARLLLVALLLLAGALNLQRAVQPAMSDDEGSYAYAAWRISQGETPYRDFLTPQLPVFLYPGGLILRLCGHSLLALRLLTTAAMLAAAALLYAINAAVFGPAVALVSTAIFLSDTNILHNARFYRPEAYMLLFALAGLYAFILAEKRGRLGYAWLGGVFFGLAIGSKLFGVLPLGGCFLYLLHACWRERRPLPQALRTALALGIPALAITAVTALVFTRISPYFITAVFEHHTMQNARLTLLQRAGRAFALYGQCIVAQPLTAILCLGGAFLLLRRDKAQRSWPAWQLPTALSFVVLSRDLFVRHMTYLAPAVGTLVAVGLLGLWQQPRRLRWLAPILALAAISWSMWTSLHPAQPEGHDIRSLAALTRQLSEPGEQVISDYPGLNFATERRSTYWAAGLSGGAVSSGQIRGAQLIDDIEHGSVAVVAINTLGPGRQIVDMQGYPEFWRYVQAHFALVAQVLEGRQRFEVYSRTDIMPVKPNVSFHGELTLTGARVAGEVHPGEQVAVDTRWQAQQRMARDYHLSLRLCDAAGHVWAQSDDVLLEQSSYTDPVTGLEVRPESPTSRWAPQQVVLQRNTLPIGKDLPAGEYYLTARVYVLDTLQPLPSGPTALGRLPGGDPIIAAVRVKPGEAPVRIDALPLTSRLEQPLVPGFELLGVGTLPKRIKAGRDLTCTLFWEAAGALAEDYGLEFRLVQGNRVLTRWATEVVPGLPTGTWQPGQALLGNYRLPVASDLPGGTCSLEVVAIDRQGHPRGEPEILADSLTVDPRLDAETVRRTLTHPLSEVTFGGWASLLGYDLSPGQLEPGSSLSLTLYWACAQPSPGDYKVFTHLLDERREIQGQSDSVPDNGNAPTSDWRPGDIIIDRYEIPLRATAQPGTLAVEIGLYDPLTGVRLPLLRAGQPAAEDRFLLPTTITVP